MKWSNCQQKRHRDIPLIDDFKLDSIILLPFVLSHNSKIAYMCPNPSVGNTGKINERYYCMLFPVAGYHRDPMRVHSPSVPGSHRQTFSRGKIRISFADDRPGLLKFILELVRIRAFFTAWRPKPLIMLLHFLRPMNEYRYSRRHPLFFVSMF